MPLARQDASSPRTRATPWRVDRSDRNSIVRLYAARISAVYLYARKDEIEAIVAALRSEERAILRALSESWRSDRERYRAARIRRTHILRPRRPRQARRRFAPRRRPTPKLG